MKGTELEKPPALLLPPVRNPSRAAPGRVHRTPVKYDNYSGIMKRVYDMKLRMDTDETTTESESSSVRTRSSRSSGTHYSDEPGSPFDDESSASSITESDHCPPYEEIPTTTNRYSSCSSIPSPPPSAKTLQSFRDSLPEPPSPLYNNEPVGFSRRSSSGSSSHYSNSDVVLRRPKSLYNNCEQDYTNTRTPLYNNVDTITTDVNKNETSEEDLKISESELRKIEMFFRSLRTELWVSSSLANLYVSLKGQENGWDYKHTGVPVLVLESGDTKSRSKRRIQIILAERGTCFPLWRDTIDNLSAYCKSGPAFHTMYLSSNHQQVIGLSFDSSDEADRLLSRIDILTANPENINISVPGAKKKKTKVKEKKQAPLPQKKQISHPCLFEHVTSVAVKDKPVYMSLKTLVDQVLMNKSENVARDQ